MGLDAMIRRLQRRGNLSRSPEYARFCERAAAIQQEDYTFRALAGINVEGKPMPGLKGPRTGAYAGKTGSVRTPNGLRSGAIVNYRQELTRDGVGRAVLTMKIVDGPYNSQGGPPGTPRRFSARKARKPPPPFTAVYSRQERVPGRKLLGVSPNARAKIAAARREFLAAHAKG